MENRWASIKLTLVLLYLGVPLMPDLPFPFTFAVLTLVLVAAVAFSPRFARSMSSSIFAPVHSPAPPSVLPGLWQLLRPVAPGMPGTVRSRAPSGLVAAHG